MTRRSARVALGVVAAAAFALLLLAGPGSRLARRYRIVWHDWRAAGRARETLPAGARLPALDLAAGWANGPALTADSLRGRVVVLALYSDTDPQALRLLPAIEAWHEAYARYGVRVVGVHAPEFAFSADPRVAARLAQRLGLAFPLALDPTLRLERALGGPAAGLRVVIAGADGRVVTNVAVRPGRLPAVEQRLREAVRAASPATPFPGGPGATGEPAADLPAARLVPLGPARVPGGPLAGAPVGVPQTFTAQFRYQEQGEAEVPYPIGRWIPGSDGLTAARGGAAQFVALRYDAPRSGPARLGSVMSPPADGPVRVWVLRDERWLPRAALGADARLDERGASYVDVDEPRLYDVARGGGAYKLSPDREGLTLHAFTIEDR